MARPEDIIAAQRARVADADRAADEARRLADIERSKLAGMEQMVEAIGSTIRPPVSVAAKTAKTGKVGGRQPGSITEAWKRVLRSLLHRESDWFDANAVVAVVANLQRREIRPSEVRRIFKKYEENGYVEQNEEGEFRITDEAITKFSLKEPQASEAADEIEAPNGEAAGASVVAGSGAPTPAPAAWSTQSGWPS